MDARVDKHGENNRARQGQAGGAHGAQPEVIEWIAGGICALITVTMIAFLIYQAVGASTAVPQLAVVVDQIRPTGGAFHVQFRIENRGDATAAGVLVHGQLMSGDEVVEEREVTIDYVPAHSEQNGALLFNHDPGHYQLQLEPHGYKEP